ncbi:hypothetical protein [Treponema sp. R8-4-B8]
MSETLYPQHRLLTHPLQNTVAPITQTTISTALALRWNDFKDAVQFITVKENKVDFILPFDVCNSYKG